MKKGTTDKIRVLIVDDQALFRSGLEMLLVNENNILEVVGSVGDGQKAVDFCKKNKVDIVLMDIEMPIMDGIEATKKIMSANPNQNILMLTMHDDPEIVQMCIEKGAKGFLSKAIDASEIFRAITSIFESGYYINEKTSKAVMAMLVKRNGAFKEKVTFSDREIEIINLISKEYSAREIAEKLLVSTRTIDNYRERILEKTGTKNTVGIIMYAIKHKLINLK